MALALGVATMEAEMIGPWYILLAGVGGGIVNSLLVERNTLILPSMSRDGGTIHLDLGFLSNVALGVAAAFLPYLFGVDKLNHHQQIGLSLLGAIGGASFIANFVYAQRAASRSAQAAAMRDALRAALEIPDPPTDGRGRLGS